MTSSTQDLAASVARAARACVADDRRIAIALSGGRDSMVLLHALHAACAGAAATLRAVHVHHGLSPNADAWVAFCQQACDALGVPLEVKRVQVTRSPGQSIEAQARERRFQALLAVDADIVALAHHADDQAETLLLQLLRGSGPHGLAAMPMRRMRGGIVLARPFLKLEAAALAAYAHEHALQWIDDESNADARYRRNALRHRVMPLLREIAPDYPATLARAAQHQSEAAELLDELAAIDAQPLLEHDAMLGLCLDAAGLRLLHASQPARARNVMRWFLRERGLRAPSTARLAQMLAQCATERPDAKIAIRHDGAQLALHAERIVVHGGVRSRPFSLPWHGEAAVQCPGGIMHARRALGAGIAATLVERGELRVTSRAGGERLRVARDRPRQAVSALFNRRRIPLWQRGAWPLIWRGDVLVAVPHFGVDPAYAAAPDAPGYALAWQPRA